MSIVCGNDFYNLWMDAIKPIPLDWTNELVNNYFYDQSVRHIMLEIKSRSKNMRIINIMIPKYIQNKYFDDISAFLSIYNRRIEKHFYIENCFIITIENETFN